MIYKIVHRSTYKYKFPVSVGNHVACLKPRSSPHQQLTRTELDIHPAPATRSERVDYYGNLLCFFRVQEPHKELTVEARSEVAVTGAVSPPQAVTWEEVAESLPGDLSAAGWRPTSLRLSRRASGCGRSSLRMRSSHSLLGGRWQRRCWI